MKRHSPDPPASRTRIPSILSSRHHVKNRRPRHPRAGMGAAASIQQEDGVWLENRNGDAARGDGEQENGIWQENK